jgi:hypothetical protein
VEERRVTTSIKIDPTLWKKAKIYCIENNLDLSQLIEKLIREELTRSKK